MKTILIVEDEKMIRQGIKTMIQRSQVPVEVILECNNGETALELIQEQKIDVMFTDIRMPKMDGITLVQRMQECENIPLTVAISGYDDFSYAVEMMRQGVREYILKPIEREKVQGILEKLDKEIEHSKENNSTIRKIGQQQLKYLMLNEKITVEEFDVLRKQYEKDFYVDPYYICVCPQQRLENKNSHYIYLNNIEEYDVFVVEEKNLPLLLRNELYESACGISRRHCGLSEVQKAYKEAVAARQRAFCRNKIHVSIDEPETKIPEQMIENARKYLTQEARLQRVQLLGTDKTKELQKAWAGFFGEVKNGRIEIEKFFTSMEEFFLDVRKTYRNVIGNETKELEKFEEMKEFKNIDHYERELMTWILNLHEQINQRIDTNKNDQKIQQAIAYIKENYAKDLNMAVVSNYISMNYSLFSYSFKQFTGNNFVNYLKEIRMEEAKRLLKETDMRVIEVSQAVGYDNEKHFMKLFKSACGVSPSEYRKNMQN